MFAVAISARFPDARTIDLPLILDTVMSAEDVWDGSLSRVIDLGVLGCWKAIIPAGSYRRQLQRNLTQQDCVKVVVFPLWIDSSIRLEVAICLLRQPDKVVMELIDLPKL